MNLIKNHRKQIGISQDDLAILIGVSRSYIGHMELDNKLASGQPLILLNEFLMLMNKMEDRETPSLPDDDIIPPFISKELERLRDRKKAVEKEWNSVHDKYLQRIRLSRLIDELKKSEKFPASRLNVLILNWNSVIDLHLLDVNLRVQKNIRDELDYLNTQIQYLSNWNQNKPHQEP